MQPRVYFVRLRLIQTLCKSPSTLTWHYEASAINVKIGRKLDVVHVGTMATCLRFIAEARCLASWKDRQNTYHCFIRTFIISLPFRSVNDLSRFACKKCWHLVHCANLLHPLRVDPVDRYNILARSSGDLFAPVNIFDARSCLNTKCGCFMKSHCVHKANLLTSWAPSASKKFAMEAFRRWVCL